MAVTARLRHGVDVKRRWNDRQCSRGGGGRRNAGCQRGKQSRLPPPLRLRSWLQTEASRYRRAFPAARRRATGASLLSKCQELSLLPRSATPPACGTAPRPKAGARPQVPRQSQPRLTRRRSRGRCHWRVGLGCRCWAWPPPTPRPSGVCLSLCGSNLLAAPHTEVPSLPTRLAEALSRPTLCAPGCLTAWRCAGAVCWLAQATRPPWAPL